MFNMSNLGFDILFNGMNFQRLCQGLAVSLKISMISIILCFPLGLAMGMLMTLKNKVLSFFLRFYLEFIRIMPQLVLLYVIYFGTASTLGLKFTAELASIIVFTLWGTAETGDLVRSALNSVPKHQHESAIALGMSPYQTFMHIVFPQAVRRLIPQCVNLMTRMIKTTSLVLMIGVTEIMKVAQQIIEANRMSSPNAAFGVYFAVLVMYFVPCFLLSLLARKLEKRWKY